MLPQIVRCSDFTGISVYFRERSVAGVLVNKTAMKSSGPIKDFFFGKDVWETRICPRGKPASGDNYATIKVKPAAFLNPLPDSVRSTLTAWLPEKLLTSIAFDGAEDCHQWGALYTDAGFETPFHVDVTGAAPIMSITTGKKRWTLALPTIHNIHAVLMERPDLIENTISVDLLPGQTLILRPSTLHHVHTPEATFGIAGMFFHRELVLEHAGQALMESRTLFGSSTYYDYAVKSVVVQPKRKRKIDAAAARATATTDLDVKQEVDEKYIGHFVQFAASRLTSVLPRLAPLVRLLEPIVGTDHALGERFEPDYLLQKTGWARIPLRVADSTTVYLCLMTATGMLSYSWNGGRGRKTVLRGGVPRMVQLPRNWTASSFYACLLALHSWEKYELVETMAEKMGTGKAFTLALVGCAMNGSTRLPAGRLSIITPLSPRCTHGPPPATHQGLPVDMFKCRVCKQCVPI